MRVFYYQYEDKTYLVCTTSLDAGSASPIWKCNTCSWLVPGTYTAQDLYEVDKMEFYLRVIQTIVMVWIAIVLILFSFNLNDIVIALHHIAPQ